jgi:hypothetical protein
MLEAGIVCPVHPSEVRFIVQTVLAKKTHEGQGLSIKELKYKVNEQCIKNNLPGEFDIPPQPESDTHHPSKHDTPIKWHMCQDFNGINKVTKVAPVSQSDIHAKQLRLSGHQYIHVFDFAAGFCGISVHPDSQPYITFFIEGRDYFAYQHMPFRVTGGPLEFRHITGECFHNLIAASVLELFMDDGGISADLLEEGIAKLQKLFEHVRCHYPLVN